MHDAYASPLSCSATSRRWSHDDADANADDRDNDNALAIAHVHKKLLNDVLISASVSVSLGARLECSTIVFAITIKDNPYFSIKIHIKHPFRQLWILFTVYRDWTPNGTKTQKSSMRYTFRDKLIIATINDYIDFDGMRAKLYWWLLNIRHWYYPMWSICIHSH